MISESQLNGFSKAAGLAALASVGGLFAQAQVEDPSYTVELPELYVSSSHTATVEPASTYGAPVSRLELNPQFDLQVRNIAEAQGDVSIRGGIFENTGFRVGAATLLDPQTGHYFAEIPVAPEMLEGPGLLVASDNAFAGFNSTVGTVDYSWTEISEGGSAAVGFGDNSLNYQRLHQATLLSVEEAAVWGAEVEASRSESAGSIENGDHNFVRYSGRLQRVGESAQTDFFAGYQSKYLAWPELYAAPYGSNESDEVRTSLFLFNHSQSCGPDSFWEATVYHRRHHDHYLFNRASVDDRSFVHQTEVSAAALNGVQAVSDVAKINYMVQLATDEIESTKLENNFTSRDYTKVSVLPEFLLSEKGERRLSLRAGLSYDDTNRDASEVSPIADITWTNGDDSYYLSFSQASQVSGYTAIGGATGGLFASNPDLEREVSRNVELGATLKRSDWSVKAAAFVREDADLVDWTYSFAATSARSAKNVDIDTYGFEVIGSKRMGQLELLASATILDKDEDYGDPSVDASFYALNYAKFRATAAAVWRATEQIQFRIDNEYRDQADNVLREGDDAAFFTHVGVYYSVPEVEGLELNASVENLWEDDFQEIPGTPGRGRQFSVGALYGW
ncbi:TonB-dependent receptor [Pelagicoccus sp. SDUM812005]|uniref:TonB-dependent receptor n=1 Tax=Pelagicoccus sp. SDUM812005 TaxID=3041257 RepID=UPI00280C9307|nr:TonB-dependent receptor [Pelagicoccus sp. SDUM812005]MDQ8180896.1 TonB-dependent receptor [Pelagicoccus sp. SDUM812005]